MLPQIFLFCIFQINIYGIFINKANARARNSFHLGFEDKISSHFKIFQFFCVKSKPPEFMQNMELSNPKYFVCGSKYQNCVSKKEVSKFEGSLEAWIFYFGFILLKGDLAL